MKKIQLMILVFCVSLTHFAFAANAKYILALSKGDKQLSIFDYQTLDFVANIPVGDDPHEIVTDNNGDFAYISKPSMRNNGHEIAVVNLSSMSLEKIIDTKPFYIPHGLQYQDGKLWFTAQGSKAVVVYDTKNDSFEQAFGTGQDFTHMMLLSSDGNTFYTTNVESGTVSIYEKQTIPPYMPPTGVLPENAEPRTEWRQTIINVGFGAEGLDISSKTNELWTARPDGHIIIVDLNQKKIKAQINTHIEGLHRLQITPDEKTVVIVSVKTGDILYYDLQTRSLEKQVKLCRGAGIFMDKESNRMFVSCTPDDVISVIDLQSREQTTRINISRPDSVTSVFR